MHALLSVRYWKGQIEGKWSLYKVFTCSQGNLEQLANNERVKLLDQLACYALMLHNQQVMHGVAIDNLRSTTYLCGCLVRNHITVAKETTITSVKLWITLRYAAVTTNYLYDFLIVPAA